MIAGLAGSALLALLSQILLARHLGPADYGFLAASLALLAMTSPYVWLGIGGFWLRIFGKEGWMARRWLPGSLKVAGITAPLAIFSFLVLGYYGFRGYESAHLIFWLAPVLLAQALAYLSQVRWQLEHKYGLVTLSNILMPSMRASVAIMAVLMGLDLRGVFVGLSLSGIVLAFFLLIGIHKFFVGRFDLAGHGPRPQTMSSSEMPGRVAVIREAWPFALQNSFEIVLLQIAVFMLATMGSPEDAAMFSVALAFVNATFMIPTAVFAGYLLPKLHRWAEHDRAKLLMAFRVMSSSMLVTGIAAGIVVVVVAPYILPFVFGEEYVLAVPLLQWLSLVIPLRFLSTAFGNPLITGEHIYRRLRLIAVSTLVSLGVCFALIPSSGAMGGVWGMIGGQFCLLVLYGYGTVRHVLGREALSHWFERPNKV